MSIPPPSHWRALVGLFVALVSACYLIAAGPLEPAVHAGPATCRVQLA